MSYDLRTIPPLLRRWAEQGIEHGGVVLVDETTIRQADIGGLADALCALWPLPRWLFALELMLYASARVELDARHAVSVNAGLDIDPMVLAALVTEPFRDRR